MLAKRASAVVLSLFGLIASMTLIAPVAHAASTKVAGKDRLTGAVAGTANHPLFGPLPFTDATFGESDGVTATGGGLITVDFTRVGLGIVKVTYRYTCLSADANVSTHRFVVIKSTNQDLAPVGATGLSSVIDGTPTGTPDTDRVLQCTVGSNAMIAADAGSTLQPRGPRTPGPPCFGDRADRHERQLVGARRPTWLPIVPSFVALRGRRDEQAGRGRSGGG